MTKRQASIGTIVLVLVLTGCPDQSTSPTGVTPTDVAALVRQLQSGDARLKLHPRGFGTHAYSAWKAQEGRADSEGTGDHALYFQKMVPTASVAAGLAVIDGVSGLSASAITGLSWEHRADGHCGAGAPRWNLGLTSPNGDRFTVFLGCAAAAHTPAGPDDKGREWIRDTYPGAAVAAQILAQTGLPASGLTVRTLLIVFDEGNDQGSGFVHLDNITVEINGQPKIFTGPMDNAR
jgi:hypothetical protein